MWNNPALNPLAGNALSGAVAPVKQLMNTIRYAQNPQAALAQALQSNPQYAQLQNILQQYGNDPGRAFRANRQADLQSQINQLQLQQAMMGVVRYPLTTAYNAGPYPPTTAGTTTG